MAGAFEIPIRVLPYLCALGSISIGAVALSRRHAEMRLPWTWLGAFGLVHAAMFWCAMSGTAAESRIAAILSAPLSLGALLALVEFGRQGSRAFWPWVPGRWILLLVGAVWIWGQMAGGPASIMEMLLAAAAAAGAGLVLYRHAQSEPEAFKRLLQWCAAGLFLHAFTGITDQGVQRIGQALSLPQAGVGGALLALAVPTLSALAGLGAAAGLTLYSFWREEIIPGSGLRRIRRRMLVGAMLCTLSAVALGFALGAVWARAAGLAALLLALAAPAVFAIQYVVLGGLANTWRALLERAGRSRFENECLLSAVVETAGDGLLVVDAEGRPVASNAAFLNMTRLSLEALRRMDEEALLATFRQQLVAPDEFLAAARDQRGTLTESLHLLRFQDGRVLRCSSRPLPEGGILAGRVWVLSDVTARAQGERERRERNARLERQSEALLHLAEGQTELYRDRPSGLRRIASIAAQTLQVEHIGIWLYGAQGEQVSCCWHYQRSADQHTEPPGDPEAEDAAHRQALISENTLAVTDVRQDPRTRGLWEGYAASRGIISTLDAPIRLRGELIGLISLGHVGPPRRWSVDERIFAGCMADCVADILDAEERQRVEQGLQRAQRFHQQVIETAATPFFMTDDDGRIRAVNDSFCAATGFYPEEIIGRHYSVLANERCGPDCPLASKDLSERASRHRCTIDTKDGRNLEIVLNASVVEDAAGRAQGRLFSFVDLTEAREARRETDSILRETEATRDMARIYRERRESLEQELEKVSTRLSAAEQTVREQGEELRRERESGGKARARLEEELRRTEARAAEAAERMRAEAAAAETRARTLDEQLSEARREIDRLAAEARQMAAEGHAQRMEAREELERARREGETASRETTELQARYEVATGARRTAEAECDRLRSELEAALTRAAQEREAQRAELEARIEKLAGEALQARGEAEQARGELQEVRGGLERTRAEGQQAQSELGQARGEALQVRGELEQARTELGGVREELERVRALGEEHRCAAEEALALAAQEAGVRLAATRRRAAQMLRLLRRAAREKLAAALRQAEERDSRTRQEADEQVAALRRALAEGTTASQEEVEKRLAELERSAAERISKALREVEERLAAARVEAERARLEAGQASKEREEARREAAEARQVADRAQREQEAARLAAGKAGQEREEARQELGLLRAQMAEHRGARAASDQAAQSSEGALSAAHERIAKLDAELQHAQEELGALRGQAQAAEASKSRFLTNLSHGIRTPMNAIVGMTDLALGGRLSADQRKQLEAVQASAKALLVLMDDLFDLARLEVGKLELEPVELDLRAVVTTALQPFVARAAQKDLVFNWSFSSDVPVALIGDPARLRQVLMNVVGNAVQFTEKGRIEVHTAIIPEQAGHVGVLFTVKDTGIGIAQDRLQTLLESPSRREEAGEGHAGLGLTITRELVRMMGGRIWAESREGTGSTFHLTVRMQCAQEAKPRQRSDGKAPAGRAQESSSAVDVEELLRLAGGNRDAAREMGEVFLKESPRMLARVRQAILGRNGMALRVAAHLIKGSAANLAADGARQSAERLESLAKKGDLDGARRELKILEAEVMRVREAIVSLSKAA